MNKKIDFSKLIIVMKSWTMDQINELKDWMNEYRSMSKNEKVNMSMEEYLYNCLFNKEVNRLNLSK
jgi:hypothetical protein